MDKVVEESSHPGPKALVEIGKAKRPELAANNTHRDTVLHFL